MDLILKYIPIYHITMRAAQIQARVPELSERAGKVE